MHAVQLKILELSTKTNIEKMGLREIGRHIGVTHPQAVLYHLNQLKKRGLLKRNSREIIEKLRKNNEQSQALLTDIPVLGAANCGIATLLANEALEGYLKVSTRLLPYSNSDGIFALRADGDSMNKANINGKNIDEGDFIIVDSNRVNPNDGDYVLSIIDGCANVKKIKFDHASECIILISESNKNYQPIYIHADDEFLINGQVISVIKKV